MKHSAYRNAYARSSNISVSDKSPVEQIAFLYENLSKQFDLLNKSIESKDSEKRIKTNEKIHNIILGLSSFWSENPVNESVKSLIDMMEEINGELLVALMHINENEDLKKCSEISRGIKSVSSLWSV